MWIVWRPASPPCPISNQRTVENYVQFRTELQRARGKPVSYKKVVQCFSPVTSFLMMGHCSFYSENTVTTAVTRSWGGGGRGLEHKKSGDARREF